MPSTVIRYFRMILTELAPKDERMEVEKDIWEFCTGIHEMIVM